MSLDAKEAARMIATQRAIVAEDPKLSGDDWWCGNASWEKCRASHGKMGTRCTGGCNDYRFEQWPPVHS